MVDSVSPRDQIQGRILDLELEGRSSRPGDERYSPELFVLTRLAEFPFERYPAYCYPGYLLKHPDMRWDHVEQTIRFCESLVQPKGSDAGKPVRLLGFQVLILTCILGPEHEDPENPGAMVRLTRTCVMTISRKNGKSALVAMLFLALISLDVFGLRAQDIHIGSGDKAQAGIIYDILEKLILMDEFLGLPRMYHLIPSKKTVVNKRTLSKVICLSSDTFRAHGLNSYGVLLDEFGNIPAPTARSFYGVLTSGYGSQAEPLTLMFSTQAPSDSHPFSEFVDAAKASNLAGGDGSGTIGIIFDLPKEDDGSGLVLEISKKDKKKTKVIDAFAEKNWVRSNPALSSIVRGGFRRIADMRKKAEEARKIPSLESTFRNLNLNQRVAALTPFIAQMVWESVQYDAPMDAEDLRDERSLTEGPCYLGLDLSSRRDLTAKAAVWRQPDETLYAKIDYWTPRDGLLEKVKVDKVPFDLWEHQGHVHVTHGSSVDYSIVAASVVEDTENYDVRRIAFDRWRMDVLRKELRACGFGEYIEDDDPLWRAVGQGFKDMTPVLEALEEAILQSKIIILRNPCSTWCAANALVVKDDAEGRKLSKAKSYGRIDGIVALAMAVFAAVEEAREEKASDGEGAYEDGKDLIILP